MQLNVKNARTVGLARELARITGETVTGALTTAIEERLARIAPKPRFTPEEIEQRIADVKQISAKIRAELIDQYGRVPTQQEFDDEMFDEVGAPR